MDNEFVPPGRRRRRRHRRVLRPAVPRAGLSDWARLRSSAAARRTDPARQTEHIEFLVAGAAATLAAALASAWQSCSRKNAWLFESGGSAARYETFMQGAQMSLYGSVAVVTELAAVIGCAYPPGDERSTLPRWKYDHASAGQ